MAVNDGHPERDGVWEPREVWRPNGTHRSRSHGTQGPERELLWEDGTKKPMGPAESRPIEEDEMRRRYGQPVSPRPSKQPRQLSPAQQRAADEFAGLLSDVLVQIINEYAVPAIKEKLVPAARRKVAELGDRRKARRSRALVQPEPEEQDANFERLSPRSSEIEPSTTMPARSMTSAEAMARWLEARRAEDFAATQRRLLASATIEDDENLPPKLSNAIQLILEGNPEKLDRQDVEAVMEYVERHRPASTEPKPLQSPDHT